MALTCQITTDKLQTSAGQNPPPMATLQVYNPNASSVSVTGIVIQYFDVNGVQMTTMPVGISTPAMGPGQTVTATTLASIYFGPFPIVLGSAASANTSLASPPASPANQPLPRSLAHPAQQFFWVGALVYASDGSVNVAGRAGVLMSFTSLPPLYTQGGVAQFNGVNNANLIAAMVA